MPQELLRCTSDDHPDYRDIATVIEMMKGVIRLINEHKRRLETVADIAQWQETIANWKVRANSGRKEITCVYKPGWMYSLKMKGLLDVMRDLFFSSLHWMVNII